MRIHSDGDTGYIYWSTVCILIQGVCTQTRNLCSCETPKYPTGELALQRGARVEATDGTLGQVDELLIDSNSKQVTHLMLLERNLLKNKGNHDPCIADRPHF